MQGCRCRSTGSARPARRPTWRSPGAAAEDSFDEFVAWCLRTAACPLEGDRVRQVFAEFRTRADPGELRLRIGAENLDIPLTSADLTETMFSAFHGPEWYLLAHAPDLAATVRRQPARIAEGSGPSPLALRLVLSCAGWPGRVDDPPAPAAGPAELDTTDDRCRARSRDHVRLGDERGQATGRPGGPQG